MIDGWTAPIHTSNLGLVLVWEDDGKLYCVLLELIKYVTSWPIPLTHLTVSRLTERHTGEYLAKRVAETLKLYQLDPYIRAPE